MRTARKLRKPLSSPILMLLLPISACRSAKDWTKHGPETCDLEETEELLDRLAGEMQRSFVSRQGSMLQIHVILVRVNDLRETAGITLISTNEFRGTPNLASAFERLREISVGLIVSRFQLRETYSERKAEEAAPIIEKDYADPHLNIRSLCSRIGVSSSYFSSLFKEHTEKTFVDFLTRTREDRAKYLLKATDLESYEIAERTGCEDHRYFC